MKSNFGNSRVEELLERGFMKPDVLEPQRIGEPTPRRDVLREFQVARMKLTPEGRQLRAQRSEWQGPAPSSRYVNGSSSDFARNPVHRPCVVEPRR